ncbi:MAG: molybdopterin dinucleotide binding domain-containing protein [Gammaproteobacteria bacterium]|nr:molybdopterin dinucleotide binding domain-containing protein [Gammaproteobacteria bacterium]
MEDNSLARLDSLWGSMLARVMVSKDQRQGSVFSPMHWNDFVAAKGRVNSLVNPTVDPISGQPESKNTPVKISPYYPAWHGFILSRQQKKPSTEYWVQIKGQQFWRYELAGATIIGDPSIWARQQLNDEVSA